MYESSQSDGDHISNARIREYIFAMYYGKSDSVVADVIAKVAERVRNNLEAVINDRDVHIDQLQAEIRRLKGVPDPDDGHPRAGNAEDV